MLKLTKIEINGFKSFYDKAEIHFPGNIVAVVGPNGCGKSNICDAITWVLGEQSAKSLRSERMDDVIFNGSARRKPLGLAEVSLTMSSTNGDFPESNGALTISRRVYRNGEGEYRINGKKSRLRDIHDMLMDTGLGLRDYSVIQQGKIDLILSTRPQDRRRLIEEAAGITKYKARKRAAEMKLDETATNLQRIADLLAELDRQCNSLKRQAGRAEKWKEVETKLVLARERLYAFGYRAQQAHLADLSKRQESLVASEGEGAARLGASEAAVSELRHRLDEELSRLSAHREEATALRGAIATKEETWKGAERRIVEAESREVDLAGRDEALTGEEARLAQATEEAERLLAAERHRLEGLRADVDAAQQERREAEGSVRGLEQETERLRRELLSVIGRANEERNRVHAVEISTERSRLLAKNLGERLERLELARAAALATVEELAAREGTLATEHAEVTQRLEALKAERASLAAEEARLRDEASRARNAAWAAEHKIESLALLVARKEKPFRDQAEMLAAIGGAAAGLLAEHLEAEPGSEELLDAALGDLAEAPVVRDGGAAAELLARARDQRSGALRFVAADQVLEIGARPKDAELAATGAIPLGSRLRAKDTALAGVGALLAGSWLVQDLGTAAALARSFPSETFYTPDRCRVRGAVFEAPGTADTSGPLTLRREIHELEGIRDRSHGQAEELLAGATATAERVAAAAAAIAELSDRKASVEKERAVIAESRRRSDVEQKNAEREIDVVRRERTVHFGDVERLEAEKADIARRLADSATKEAELGEVLAGRTASLTELREQLGPKVQRATSLQTEAGVAAERVLGLERDGRALAERSAAATRQRQQIATERQGLVEARTEAAGVREAALYGLRDDLVDLDRLTDLVIDEEEVLSDEKAALEAREATLSEERARLEETRSGRHQVEVDLASARAALDHLVESCGRDLHRPPTELPDPGEAAEGELEALRGEAEGHVQQLEKMGVVNLLALEEFGEADTRRTFLRTQHDDLVNSIASLRDTIKKINETSSERFTEAFAVINANFTALFQELFRGGTAEMRLIDETDPLESGIEIMARPPGKNNQSILLLSGGEKALTAISLLMAIFRFKPSPFCILDEVDAPLDEPNIDRFTRILQHMTGDTQFIVITHSKRTMEMADVLYGVTMEEAGCSKLVSVKLAN